MKFYKRFPDRALAGMSGLTPGQRGIYNSVIDLLYSRDGLVPCLTEADDRQIARNISVDLRTWRSLKSQLLKIGKIWITNDGLLNANGVDEGRIDAEIRSDTARKRVRHRWDLYRLSKKINGAALHLGNTIESKSKNSELPLPLEHAKPPAVDKSPPASFPVTAQLEAQLRRKGWL